MECTDNSGSSEAAFIFPELIQTDRVAGGSQGRAGEDRVSLFKKELKKFLESKHLAGVQQDQEAAVLAGAEFIACVKCLD